MKMRKYHQNTINKTQFKCSKIKVSGLMLICQLYFLHFIFLIPSHP